MIPRITRPNNKMNIYYILDKSGSMTERADKVISGINEFIQEHKKIDQEECKVSLYFFNMDLEILFENKPIAEVELLTREKYNPIGCTALLDAMGHVIQKIPLDQKSVLIIVTDGEENSSSKYTSSCILDMIESRKNSLHIVYMGSNQDAILNGSKIGAHRTSCLMYKDHHIEEAMRCTSAALKRYRTNETDGIVYTPVERETSVGRVT